VTNERLTLAAPTSALVLIDLQNLIVDLPLSPVAGRDLARDAMAFARRVRDAGGVVIVVRADMAGDPRAALHQQVDQPMVHPKGPLPDNWADVVEGLLVPGDVLVTKRQWGAFFGTDLDLQLRRRGIRTVVLGGIATNFGVESTARQAHEHGYEIVVAQDLTASFTTEMHDFAMEQVFRRIGRVRQAADIVFA
jgi:nicotinamidase-related amidase